MCKVTQTMSKDYRQTRIALVLLISFCINRFNWVWASFEGQYFANFIYYRQCQKKTVFRTNINMQNCFILIEVNMNAITSCIIIKLQICSNNNKKKIKKINSLWYIVPFMIINIHPQTEINNWRFYIFDKIFVLTLFEERQCGTFLTEFFKLSKMVFFYIINTFTSQMSWCLLLCKTISSLAKCSNSILNQFHKW